jgi:hypothetical protein
MEREKTYLPPMDDSSDWPLWRYGEEAEKLYLGSQVRISAGTPYFPYDEGNFRETSLPEDRLVTIVGTSVAMNDGRYTGIPVDPSLPHPVIDLRFEEDGHSSWVRAHLITLAPTALGRRSRLSPLAR